MSVQQDQISDFLTQIRNSLLRRKKYIKIYSSKIKIGISKILKDEGYINDFNIIEEKNKCYLKLILKYVKKKPCIKKILRISKPSLRVYKKFNNIPFVIGGYGISIISTSKGLMTDKKARSKHVGGELLCEVY